MSFSQDPVLCSVTLGVSHFERCALWVQVLYYPFSGDHHGDYDEDQPLTRQKRNAKTELGEPVILRCQPYKIPLTELLSSHRCSPVEYFRLWPSLPAILEFTGTYTYEGSGFSATAAQQTGSSPFLSGLRSLSSKPFHQVCSHILRTVAGFQVRQISVTDQINSESHLSLSLKIYVCVCVCLSVNIYLSIWLHAYHPTYLSIFLAILLAVYLSLFHFLSLYIHLFIYPPINLSSDTSIHLSIPPSILPICPSLCLSV